MKVVVKPIRKFHQMKSWDKFKENLKRKPIFLQTQKDKMLFILYVYDHFGFYNKIKSKSTSSEIRAEEKKIGLRFDFEKCKNEKEKKPEM
jgi:hypothetical protein